MSSNTYAMNMDIYLEESIVYKNEFFHLIFWFSYNQDDRWKHLEYAFENKKNEILSEK